MSTATTEKTLDLRFVRPKFDRVPRPAGLSVPDPFAIARAANARRPGWSASLAPPNRDAAVERSIAATLPRATR